MSFHISVDKTSVDGGSRELYHNPLGTGTQLSEFWFCPARELGLTFFDTHFTDCMEVSGDDLDLLASDLDRLEQHWLGSRICDGKQVQYSRTREDGSREEGYTPMREHLLTRLGFLREAIGIAKQAGGVLWVG